MHICRVTHAKVKQRSTQAISLGASLHVRQQKGLLAHGGNVDNFERMYEVIKEYHKLHTYAIKFFLLWEY